MAKQKVYLLDEDLESIKKTYSNLSEEEILMQWCDNKFSNLIRQYRIDHDLKQEEIAPKLGVSKARVASFEVNPKSLSLKTIVHVANALGYEFHFDFVKKN